MYTMNSPAEIPVECVLDTGVSADAFIRTSSPLTSATPVVIRPAAPLRLAAANAIMQSALDGNGAIDEALDQYYTDQEIARGCYGVVGDHFDLMASQLVEPSAGDGSFFRLMPPGSVAVDVDPRFAGIITADFLSIEIESVRPILTIGNPPFGQNSELAVRFFNHAASFSEGIGLVVPRTFRKASILRRLHRHFHLVREVTLPPDAFRFRGKPFDVPAVFQVWKRRPFLRDLPRTETTHPDFDFTVREDADFALQRVGANAGRVHRNFKLKKSSHYFIRANVKGVKARMVALGTEFAAVAANTAGNPSLAQSEIVALYRELTEGVPVHWRLRKSAPMALGAQFSISRRI